MAQAQQSPEIDRAEVLTRAVMRAAEILGVRHSTLAGILGVSEASVSRLGSERRHMDPESKEGELGMLFLRVYRSLDALLGGHTDQCRAWFDAPNDHLGGGIPRELVVTVHGLVDVLQYLDAIRGKV